MGKGKEGELENEPLSVRSASALTFFSSCAKIKKQCEQGFCIKECETEIWFGRYLLSGFF